MEILTGQGSQNGQVNYRVWFTSAEVVKCLYTLPLIERKD